MSDYPEVVARIADDYLERVKAQLRLVPAPEQDEFLKEIHSHVYEAYQQTPGDDDVARIFAVLRNLGEPADLVADRLPDRMVRTGTSRNLPLYLAGGVFLALFGLPLGFGGIGVLLGLLGALVGLLVAYFALTGSVLLTGAVCLLLGLVRLFLPRLWDGLVAMGAIQVKSGLADVLDYLSGPEQALIILIIGALLAAAGLGMLWLGKHMFSGLRFLVRLAFDWMLRLAAGARRKLRSQPKPQHGWAPPGNPAGARFRRYVH
jgi:uncharacterized membrane protein